MFENISSPLPQMLHIGTNILKGGDFMERDVPGPVGPAGRIPDSVNDPRFPKVVGRTIPELPTVLEIATTRDKAGRPAIDPVTLKSVTSMEGGD